MHATLLRTDDGAPIEAQAEGPPDSVLAVVDRLVADLLVRSKVRCGSARPPFADHDIAARASSVSRRTGRLPRRPLPSALRHFESALRLDSTFALAAIGYFKAVGWGAAGDQARGVRIAWNNRERLGPRDRALLDNYTGPRYPAQNFSRSNIQSAERLVQLAPDDAEAHQEYGDALYHFGDQVDYPDPWPVARRAFERAVALDSGFAAPLDHLIQITAATGDTAALRRFFALRSGLVAKVRRRSASAITGATPMPLRTRSSWILSTGRSRRTAGRATSSRWAWPAPWIFRPSSACSKKAAGVRRPKGAVGSRFSSAIQVALNNGQPARAARLLDSFAIRSPTRASPMCYG